MGASVASKDALMDSLGKWACSLARSSKARTYLTNKPAHLQNKSGAALQEFLGTVNVVEGSYKKSGAALFLTL